MDPEDVRVWYIMMTNLLGTDDEFASGEYIIKLTMPVEFPNKPPSFVCLTPNGLYDIGGKICISIGEFHSQRYKPSEGILGFCTSVISGFLDWKTLGNGIRLTSTTLEQKKKYARNSAAYNNEKHPEIVKLINDSYNEYKTKFQEQVVYREPIDDLLAELTL